MNDKAVILAAGLGTRKRRDDSSGTLSDRQRAAASTGVKALIPIDRPFLDYVLTNVADAGYHRVCLVVGPDHDALREYYENLSGGRLTFEFAVQPKPLGTANALAVAAEFAGDDPVLVLNSDNHYPTDALRSLRKIDGNATVGFERGAMLAGGNIPPDRVAKFSIIEPDERGNLRRIIEKPAPAIVDRLPEPILVSMNCWQFGPAIFQACRSIEKSPRGEYEIPDAVMASIERLDQQYRVIPSRHTVLDLSSRRDIASVTQLLRNEEVRL
ncbi:MAG: nucleotidyltransferase family protein [Pirellulales bacterium]